jgi:hypothetical protein
MSIAEASLMEVDEVDSVGLDPRERRRLGRQIAKYCRDFIAALFEDEVPAPGQGDCWYCLLRDKESGLPLGEAMQTLHPDGSLTRQPSPDHLISHMEEKYYVPSLLVRATEVFPISPFAALALQDLWGEEGEASLLFEDVARKQLKNSLRRYMRKQLGLAS